MRKCWRCGAVILESMGAVLARDILHLTPQPVRELCGRCVGKLCYSSDEVITDLPK